MVPSDSAIDMVGGFPCPESLTVRLPPSLLIVKLPVNVPPEIGENLTVSVVETPGASCKKFESEQLVNCEGRFSILNGAFGNGSIQLIFKVLPPVFTIWKVILLVWLAVTVPKFSSAGEREVLSRLSRVNSG